MSGPAQAPSSQGFQRGFRRPLSAALGAVHCEGERGAAELLRDALCAPPLPIRLTEEERRVVEDSLHVHLFHSFAARMHPLTARRLLRSLQPGQRVLDPFVGSGTVLVEALLMGGRGLGLDVNELAVRLSRFKAQGMPAGMQQALLHKAAEVAARSTERVKTRQRPGRVWDQPRFYEPHVYLELCGLREEIEAARREDGPIGEALLLCLSSLIIKASRLRSETQPALPPTNTKGAAPPQPPQPGDAPERHLGRLQVTRWFQHRAEELARLLAAYQHRREGDAAPPRGKGGKDLQLLRGDARRDLHRLAPAGSVDLVLTSPPYLGVYDYGAHHARRWAFLDINGAPALAEEMAARRAAAGRTLPDLLQQHQRDTLAWMGAVAQALRPGAAVLVLVGDSVVHHQRVPGDRPLRDAARALRLPLQAACSVERPQAPVHDVDGGPPLREHLLRFVKP